MNPPRRLNAGTASLPFRRGWATIKIAHAPWTLVAARLPYYVQRYVVAMSSWRVEFVFLGGHNFAGKSNTPPLVYKVIAFLSWDRRILMPS